ncbi:MAG: alpha/beta hydrolase [Rhodospirillaceae bacterium]|nr:alpha/beta hydrolase [Rhodospirillaceae bacterium]
MSAALEAIIARIRATYGSWGRGTTIDTMRREFLALQAPGHAPPLPRFLANGVPAAWIGDAALGDAGAILYFHGGGFQLGSVDSHRLLIEALAAAARCRVMAIDYRLAPEHRFPAPIEDTLSAYRWLESSGYAPDRIALAGDSAGGGLALSLLLALKARDAALPAAAALMSPWTDMEASGESYASRADADPIHQRPMIQALARSYLGRTGNPSDPLASPLLGDLAGLPPLLIQVGDRETVLDDSRRLAARAHAAGVEATLDVWDGMIHVFQLYTAELAEAREAIGRLGAFLRRHLDAAKAG